MAGEPRIVQYVKEQLSAGYAEKDIRDALLDQGWQPDEIDEAFSAAGGPPKEKPAGPEERPAGRKAGKPVKEAAGAGMGFVLSIAGGALIVLNSVLVFIGMGDMLGLFVSNLNLSLLAALIELSVFDRFLVNMIVGSFLIAASIMVYMIPDRARLTGMFILALSVVSVLVGNGFLVGGIVAIMGGLLAVLGR
jgi:hypothetical protein